MKTALQCLTLSLTLTLNQAKMGCLGAGSAHEALAWLRVAASQGLSAAETAACEVEAQSQTGAAAAIGRAAAAPADTVGRG